MGLMGAMEEKDMGKKKPLLTPDVTKITMGVGLIIASISIIASSYSNVIALILGIILFLFGLAVMLWGLFSRNKSEEALERIADIKEDEVKIMEENLLIERKKLEYYEKEHGLDDDGLTGNVGAESKALRIQDYSFNLLRDYGPGRWNKRKKELIDEFNVVNPNPIVLSDKFEKRFNLSKGNVVTAICGKKKMKGQIVGFVYNRDNFTFPTNIVSEFHMQYGQVYKLDYNKERQELYIS